MNKLERINQLKDIIRGLGVGAPVSFETDFHVLTGHIKELKLDDDKPHIVMSARRYKRVRVDLKNIKRIL